MPDSDVAIRPEAPGDEEAIDEVVRDAFMQQFGSDSEVLLVRNLRDRGELVPDLTLVAVRNSRVVGFIAFSESLSMVSAQRVSALPRSPSRPGSKEMASVRRSSAPG